MALLRKNWRTFIALAVAVMLVAGAYVLALGKTFAPYAIATTENELLKAISIKDTDGDGLVDWEEILYGTDPRTVDTRGLGMTDGEAVAKGLIVPVASTPTDPQTTDTSSSAAEYGLVSPAKGSLTESFAQNFFSLYIREKQANGGRALTSEESAKLAEEAVSALASSIAPAQDYKSQKDISVRGEGVDALRAFAASAETVLLANRVTGTKGELAYLEDLVIRGDKSAIAHLTSVADGYRRAATGLTALPVPRELAITHLAIINALARVSDITRDFSVVETDPLATMFALGQYAPTVLDLGNAFIAIGKIYADAGVTLGAGEPGASFVNLMRDIAAEQAEQNI